MVHAHPKVTSLSEIAVRMRECYDQTIQTSNDHMQELIESEIARKEIEGKKKEFRLNFYALDFRFLVLGEKLNFSMGK